MLEEKRALCSTGLFTSALEATLAARQRHSKNWLKAFAGYFVQSISTSPTMKLSSIHPNVWMMRQGSLLTLPACDSLLFSLFHYFHGQVTSRMPFHKKSLYTRLFDLQSSCVDPFAQHKWLVVLITVSSAPFRSSCVLVRTSVVCILHLCPNGLRSRHGKISLRMVFLDR